MQAGDLRPGMAIMFNGQIHKVEEFQHVTPGNWRAMIQTTLRSLKTGKAVKNRFRPQDNVEEVFLEPKPCQYLYHDQGLYYFLDLEDYQNHSVSSEIIGERSHYLAENLEVKLLIHDGVVIDAELPTSVILKITQTEPGSRGDTVTNVMKMATVETGYQIQVPIFIKEGEAVKVDTRTGQYLGRS
ncbi:MAG: elongation factor P [Chlamydiae bacterium]|nr:elongation factor P [Chlamydiota bacterium]MBI3277775.1 elongation factor P [Chlamydiota bacterium]